MGDEKSRLLHKSVGLSGAEKDMLLDVIENRAQLRGPGGPA